MMTMDVVIGVDSSTQSCKVEVRRLDDGRFLGIGSAPHQPTFPPVSRQDPSSWWDAFRLAFDVALRSAGVTPADVRGISVAAQCHGLVMLDGDGEPLAPAPLWNDTTAGAVAQEIRDEYGVQAWMRDVGLAPSAALTVMKLAHVARTEPHLLERTARVMVPHDYLTFRLTGRAVTDRSDAGGTGYFDVHRGRWRPELLRRFVRPDAPWEEMLTEVLGPGEAAGPVQGPVAKELGLREDTLVGPGGGDQHLAAVGLGLSPGDLGVSLGTSGVVFSPTRESVVDPEGIVDSVCDTTGGYLPLACTLNSTKVTDTFARLLGVELAEMEAMALRVTPHPDRPLLVAYLDGERTPPVPSGVGVLGGITSGTSREEVAFAAYAGVIANLLVAADGLERAGVRTEGPVVVNGGGARSFAYRQLLADALQRPVRRADADEASARGASVQIAAILRDRPIGELAAEWSPDPVDEVTPRGTSPEQNGEFRARLRGVAFR